MKSGIELSHIKTSVRPQDDLYRHMNGTWIDSAQIPADRSSDGAFYELFQNAEKQVREIIEELGVSKQSHGSNAKKIGDMYGSFMDSEAIEKKGLSPIAKALASAASISDLDSFISTLGELESIGLAALFYGYVTTDNKDSSKNIAYLGQAGLSLPDEAYYRDEEFTEIRSALLAHIEKIMNLAEIEGANEKALLILDLETKIAACHWDQVKDRDALATYNKFDHESLQRLTPNFNWNRWLIASQTPDKVLRELIIRQPSFFSGISELLGNFENKAWSAWLQWHVLSSAAPYLPTRFVEENFNFYGTVLSGTPELKARWKRGVALVEGCLGEALGQIYVERHFPQAAKERMKVLVNNLIEAYRIEIGALTWMSSDTKTRAFEKLSKFTPKIGYPDKWRDYSKLTITKDDLMANVAAVTKFNQEYEYAKLGAPVDKGEWLMTPQTVNAYYNPGMNEIVFPAAILQRPFFDMEADDAANYGGIGAVIGHEIGHGFDDQGSRYDGDGNLNNWWTDFDRSEFEKRADQIISQYDQLSPLETPDIKVNGALTIGENIGDIGGLAIAFKAYQLSLAGKVAPVIDGFTGEQRFFLGWAQCWRQKMRPEEIRRRVATDPHSPDEFRCNQVVRNLDEFYAAFNIQKDDLLFLPQEERVRIW